MHLVRVLSPVPCPANTPGGQGTIEMVGSYHTALALRLQADPRMLGWADAAAASCIIHLSTHVSGLRAAASYPSCGLRLSSSRRRIEKTTRKEKYRRAVARPC